jgi:hypothetical protein
MQQEQEKDARKSVAITGAACKVSTPVTTASFPST